jgi:hypothetical protein
LAKLKSLALALHAKKRTLDNKNRSDAGNFPAPNGCGGKPMSDETAEEADCVLCRDLDAGQCAAMRAKLIEIPIREHVCDPCMDAFTANLFASFPKTEEERLSWRAEMNRK